MASSAMKQDATSTETRSHEPLEHKQIAQLAYVLWQARGCPEGSAEVDWFRAEQEFTSSF